MKLLDKPYIENGMDTGEISFRNEIHDYLLKLPTYSKFINPASYKILGYANNGISAAVAIIQSDNQKFAVKVRKDNKVSEEFFCLKSWQKAGVEVIEPMELIEHNSDLPYNISILEFVDTERASLSIENLKWSAKKYIFRSLGENLYRMQTINSDSYGRVIIVDNRIAGNGLSISEEINEILPEEVIKGIAYEFDTNVVNIAKQVIINSVSKNSKACLIHHELGLHNVFYRDEKIKIFDAKPRFSHPIFDVAMAIIWNRWVGEEMIDIILNEYKDNLSIDDTVLSAALLIEQLRKLALWEKRVVNNPKVKLWLPMAYKIVDEQIAVLNKLF